MASFVVDRYEIFTELASGGEGTVFIGRLVGDGGFVRIVAVKRLHPHLCKDPAAVAPFRDEARIASRIRHPNVVATLDVVDHAGTLYTVMDYVAGTTLEAVARATAAARRPVPPSIVAAIACDMLEGLHAAHEATDDRGAPLEVVHRDVSPQNVLVGLDGVARIADFGVAKATGRLAVTTDDRLKGKIGYFAPEHILGAVDRRTDIFSASIVLWELLANRRLFDEVDAARAMARVLAGDVPHIEVSPAARALLDVVLVGLEAAPEARFADAHEMAAAIRRVADVASAYDVAEWIRDVSGEELAARQELVRAVESAPSPRRSGNVGVAIRAAAAFAVVLTLLGVATAYVAPSRAATAASIRIASTVRMGVAPAPSHTVAPPATVASPATMAAKRQSGFARVGASTAPARCQKSWWDARGVRHFNPDCDLD